MIKDSRIAISVIVPVYNSEDFLNQCIDSILNQTMKEIEIICIDDGSTDGSLQILNKYSELDKRVIIINQKNLHAGVARNRGLDIARGEYIHFMDSDDYLELDAYDNMYSTAKEFNADFVKTKSYELDFEKNEIVKSTIDSRYACSTLEQSNFNKPLCFDENTWKIFLKKISVVPWNGIYKLDMIKMHDIKFNDLRCVNDRSFYFNLLLNAKTIIISEYYTIIHRINRNDSLVGKRIGNFDCYFKSYNICKKLCDGVNPKYSALLLNNELATIHWWLKILIDDEVYGAKIMESTSEFINNVDGDFFDEYLPDDFKNRCTLIKEVLSSKK